MFQNRTQLNDYELITSVRVCLKVFSQSVDSNIRQYM